MRRDSYVSRANHNIRLWSRNLHTDLRFVLCKRNNDGHLLYVSGAKLQLHRDGQ